MLTQTSPPLPYGSWLYALAASEIKRKGWTIAEVMLDDEKKLAMANYAGLRLLTEFKLDEEEVREPRATRNLLLMGSRDDSMFSWELVNHIYDALPDASRAAATVNVYDEEDGGALHCREGVEPIVTVEAEQFVASEERQWRVGPLFEPPRRPSSTRTLTRTLRAAKGRSSGTT